MNTCPVCGESCGRALKLTQPTTDTTLAGDSLPGDYCEWRLESGLWGVYGHG